MKIFVEVRNWLNLEFSLSLVQNFKTFFAVRDLCFRATYYWLPIITYYLCFRATYLPSDY